MDTEYEYKLPTDARAQKFRVRINFIGEISISVKIDAENLPPRNQFNVNNFLDLLLHQYYTLPVSCHR